MFCSVKFSKLIQCVAFDDTRAPKRNMLETQSLYLSITNKSHIFHSFSPITIISSVAAVMIFRPMIALCVCTFTSFIQLVQAQDFWPAAVPLCLKSPYLNSWLALPPSEAPPNLFRWPGPWTMNRVGHSFCAILAKQIIISRCLAL